VIDQLITARDAAGLLAPNSFAAWMSSRIANDKKHGRQVYRYHPRSDEHSKRLCALILEDLQSVCPLVGKHLASGNVVAGINATVQFPNGKLKTLDLAVGEPAAAPSDALRLIGIDTDARIGRVRFSCEAKQCMTEHSKTKPRIFDELSSSHEIVHQGEPNAIATGVVVVNIASQFASPLRQAPQPAAVVFLSHRQPHVTQDMIMHLRGLKRRSKSGDVGFDAFATIVVDCDNVGPCLLHTASPAPRAIQTNTGRSYEQLLNFTLTTIPEFESRALARITLSALKAT
jgi:hypothetical protein